MRRLLLALASALVLGALLLREMGSAPRGVSVSPSAPLHANAVPAELAAAEEGTVPAATVEATLPEPAGASREPVAVPAAESDDTPAAERAQIVVYVYSSETELPVIGQRLVVVPEKPGARASRYTEVDESTGDLEHAPRTDAQGQALFLVPAGSYRVVRPSPKGLRFAEGRSVFDLLPGQVREVTLWIPTEPLSPFVLRLEDARTRLPVREATLNLELSSDVRNPPSDALLGLQEQWAELSPDERGTIRGRIFAAALHHVSIRAPGYLTSLLTLEAGHESDERAALVLLHPTARLRARIQDERGRALPDVELRLHLGLGARLTLLAQSNQPSPDILVLHARTDADGFAVFEHLIPGQLYIPALWRDGVSRTGFSAPIVLGSGEERELTWSLAGCEVTGQVLDLADEGVSEQRVWIEAVDERTSGSSERRATLPVATATTDADGRFSFRGICPGAWRVASMGEDSSVDGSTEGPSLPAARLDIQGGEWTRHVVLRSPRGGPYLRGGVVDEEGRPAVSALVRATGPMLAAARTDESGAFALGPLLPGLYEIAVSHPMWSASSSAKVRDVPAGTEAIAIALRPRGVVHGELIAAAGARGLAILSALDSSESDRSSIHAGEFRLSASAAGTHGLVIQLDDGRAALLAPIEVGSEESVGPLRVEPRAGARLRLLVADALLSDSYSVRVDGWLVQNVSMSVPSRDVVLPPGQCTVETPEGRVLATFPLAAGEYRELVLGGSGSR